MAFTSWSYNSFVTFNSAVSDKFLRSYTEFVDNKLIQESKERSHRTFAPSSFRCDRRSWFRIRGVDPDEVKLPDRTLDFTAKIGTACHLMIQNYLKECLGEDWIDVSDHISELTTGYDYNCCGSEDSLETLVDVSSPPVRFACDGIVRIDGVKYLLEIKSSEYAAWKDLSCPKSHHIDQVECYCTLLQLDKVLFIYVDRQYGGMKCFEHAVTSDNKMKVISKFNSVLKAVEDNIAPEPLPKGSSWCSPSMCPYYKKCEEYGR